MTQGDALNLFEDLQDLEALRKNRIWLNRIVPEIQRMQTEARVGMRDRTKTAEERCERVAEHELANSLLDFLDKEEARMRAALKAHDDGADIIVRPFR